MNLNKWMRDNMEVFSCEDRVIVYRPTFKCRDGLQLSIQASSSHYSNPKSHIGPYESVEIGFPSEPIEELKDYTSDEEIYGWVPVELVEEVIEKHGGAARSFGGE